MFFVASCAPVAKKDIQQSAPQVMEEIQPAEETKPQQETVAERRAKMLASAYRNTALPPDEPVLVWVVEQLTPATDGVEGVDVFCVDADERTHCMITDSDADVIRTWAENVPKRLRWGFQSVEKSFVTPVALTDPSDAIRYLLSVIRHHGAYTRMSVDECRSTLADIFSRMQFPDMFDKTIDIALWLKAVQPLFLANIPGGVASRTEAYGRTPTSNDALEAFQRDVFNRGKVRVMIEYREWRWEGQPFSDIWSYFVVLQSEDGHEKVAQIHDWHGHLKEFPIVDGEIVHPADDFRR